MTRDPNDPRNEPVVPCSWSGCTSSKPIGARVALCGWHYNLVRDDWIADMARKREGQAARVKAASAKLEAGKGLDAGDPVPGWVYYIRVGDLVKIGHAKVLQGRLAAYPPNAELLAVEPGTRAIERARHETFRPFLAEAREWYRPSALLDEWIAEVREKHGDPSAKAYRPQRDYGRGAIKVKSKKTRVIRRRA